jgi:hypothetical protein
LGKKSIGAVGIVPKFPELTKSIFQFRSLEILRIVFVEDITLPCPFKVNAIVLLAEEPADTIRLLVVITLVKIRGHQ